MLETIKVTMLARARRADFWIWCLAFPIILATLFIFMFGNLKNSEVVATVPVAVVTDDAWESSGFSRVVDALSGDGSDALLDVVEVSGAGEAERLLDDGEVCGVYAVDDGGDPQVTLGGTASSTEGSSDEAVNRSILEAVASSYTQSYALVERTIEDDPSVLADPSAIARALGIQAEVQRVSLTRSTPDDTVRFYYALLGMAALYASTSAASALLDAAGDLSPLGARRCVGGQSRLSMLVGTLLGCWRLALLGLAASSLFSVTLGMLAAALPIGGGKQSRTGLLTAVNCVGSLFAGLYGTPAMRLADEVARVCPAEAWLNPPKLISDTFTNLYFYEGLWPFFSHVLACVGLAVAFLAVTTLVFRRQRYEHL